MLYYLHIINFTGLEFIYAQSPHAMKGLLIGFLFCEDGLCSAVATALFITTPTSKHLCFASPNNFIGNCTIWYYVFYTIVAIIGLGMYIAVATMYKNRIRDKIDNHHNLVEEYYDKVHTNWARQQWPE